MVEGIEVGAVPPGAVMGVAVGAEAGGVVGVIAGFEPCVGWGVCDVLDVIGVGLLEVPFVGVEWVFFEADCVTTA